MADLRRKNGREQALEADVLRRRQRELGLRRQHAAGVLRRPVPALPDLREELRRQPHLQDRLRPQRRQLRLDRGADAGPARPAADDAGPGPPLLLRHRPGQPLGHGVHGDRLVLESARAPCGSRSSSTGTRRSWTSTTRRSASRSSFDEWGAWHAVEPGTNPGFLYQQNSLRDAMVAGLTLNIFNNHCDRVKMANIAQTDQRPAGDDPDRRRQDGPDADLLRVPTCTRCTTTPRCCRRELAGPGVRVRGQQTSCRR